MSPAIKERIQRITRIPGVLSVDVSGIQVSESLERTSVTRRLPSSPSDAELLATIRNVFQYEPRLRPFALRIAVADGKATLTGSVTHIKAKALASSNVLAIPGVRTVDNQILIEPMAAKTDERLTAEARDLLLLDPTLDEAQLSIHVAKGVATLQGQVASSHEHYLAQEALSRLRGLTEVQSLVTVDKSASKSASDEAVSAAFKNGLSHDLRLEPEDDIRIEIKDGVALLSGEVDTWYEQLLATRHAFSAGARSVISQIGVGQADAAGSTNRQEGSRFERVPEDVYFFEWRAPAVASTGS